VAIDARPELLVDGETQRVLAGNPAAARVYGYRPGELAGLPLSALWPAAPGALAAARGDGTMRLAQQQRRDGRPLHVAIQVRNGGASGDTVRLVANEVSDRAFTLALMESQGSMLQLIAGGAALEKILESLILAIERLSSDMVGSVLLLSEDGWHVRHGAAPNLPLAYWSALEGARIGRQAGSCGTAMYRAKAVIVEDIEHNPLWRPWRKLALQHGLRACWSMPILSRHRRVLGSFALYYRDVRTPRPRERRLVEVAADLAAIAIERERSVATAPSPAAMADRRHEGLSPRELQIVRLLARGDSAKRVASALSLSVNTVYSHRANILEKLGVASNVELAHYAVHHRLVT
jgi:DNA-binding CsgD family transcriptional regulator